MSELGFRDQDELVPILEARAAPGYLIPRRPPTPSDFCLDLVRVRRLSDSTDRADSLLADVFNRSKAPPNV
jgi:hypothetical protein